MVCGLPQKWGRPSFSLKYGLIMHKRLKAYPFDKQIDDIMADFDFNKIKLVMDFLDWKWRDEGVPSITQLKQTAVNLLTGVAEMATKAGNGKYGYIATGGFHADVRQYRLSLFFHVLHDKAYIESDDFIDEK